MKHALATILSSSLAAAASASSVQIQVYSPFQFGSGGEFRATPQSGYVGLVGLAGDLDAGSFQTFCVETNEHLFESNGTYHAILNFGAVNGGAGGQDPVGSNYDPLDDRTAYLYERFRRGTLPGYFNYSGGRQQAAGALQAAIWFIENEADYDGVLAGGRGAGLQQLALDFLQLANDAEANGYRNRNVRIMNLDQGGGVRQDLLTLVPLPSGALGAMVSFASLGCFAILRRRR